MPKRLLVPILALLAVCSYTLSAAQDSEIQQLKEMIKAQNAKIANLERAQAANQTTGRVDKAIAGKCYLSPDKPDIDGVGLSFTGEFLYWTVQRSKDVVAQWNDLTTPPPFPNVADTETGSFGWNPGFRLGLNYQLPHDGWDLGVNYTYFHTGEETDHYVDADLTDGMFLATPYNGTMSSFFWGPPIGAQPVDEVISTREFDYDCVNVELGRNTAISESLSIRFFGGPSIVWTDMETQINYYGNTFQPFDGVTYGLEHKNTAESTMYGIRLGGDAEMKLGYGFSLLGKAAGALYAADTKYNTFEAIDGIVAADGIVNAGEVWANTTIDDYRIVPAVEVEAGVEWEKKLLGNLNFRVFAGYQFRNYFGLYERRTTNWDATEVNSDIGMHGLVFRVKLDF